MNYPDGTKVRLGDTLKLWEGCVGTVVCSIDDDEYTPQYPKTEWGYLDRGVLIESEQAGLIHYIEPEVSFKLIERKGGTNQSERKES